MMNGRQVRRVHASSVSADVVQVVVVGNRDDERFVDGPVRLEVVLYVNPVPNLNLPVASAID